MNKFLKFSFTIINLSSIKQIDIQSNKYDIYLNDNIIKGNLNIFRLGGLYSKSTKIQISNITHPYDYDKMTNWIKNLDNQDYIITNLL
jgi:hypothetical protein